MYANLVCIHPKNTKVLCFCLNSLDHSVKVQLIMVGKGDQTNADTVCGGGADKYF